MPIKMLRMSKEGQNGDEKAHSPVNLQTSLTSAGC